MSSPLEEEWERATTRAPPRVAAAASAVRVDLSWLHAVWVALMYADGYALEYSVVPSQRPETAIGLAAYRLWAGLGVLFVLVAYPLFVAGLAARYYAGRIDRVSAGLGFAGVAAVSLLVWGLFAAATYVSSIAFEGFVAVGVAGLVASASAVLGLYFARRDGRRSTVLVAYPLGVTALFLPPVVASLYSPTLASIVFPRSESLAVWILNNLLWVGGLAAFIRASFELEGVAYVGMWFVLAVPVGWFLGALVTFVADARESRRPNSPADVDARLSR